MLFPKESPSQRFAAAFSYRLAARFGAAFLQGAALVVLARELGPEVFGALVLGTSVAAVLGSLTALGAPTRALRGSSARSPTNLNGQIRTVSLVSGLVNSAAIATLATLTGMGTWSVLAAVMLLTVSDQYMIGLQASLAGQYRHKAAATLIVMQRLVPSTAVGFAVVIDLQAVGAYIAGLSVNTLFCLGHWLSGRPRRFSLRQFVIESRGYWAATWTPALANLDAVVVRIAAGSAAVGLYGAATRLVSPLNVAVNALLAILVPEAGRLRDDNARIRMFRRAQYWAIGFAVAMSLASPLLASAVIHLLGTDFREAYRIVIGVIVGVSISAVSQVVRAELIALAMAGRSAIAIGCGTVLGLLTLAWLAVVLGVDGLWLGPIVTQGVILGLLLATARGARREARSK